MGISIIERLFKKQIQQSVLNGIQRQLPALMQRAVGNQFNGGLLLGLPVYNSADAIANIQRGYLTSDDVYSIVRRIAKTAAMIPLKVYRIKDEVALKEYELHKKNNNFSANAILKGKVLQMKAMELVEASDPLQSLLDNPNEVYSRTEFLEGVYGFRLITGNTYILTPLLELGVNAGKVAEMWLLPSQFMSLQVADSFPRRIISYRLQLQQLVLYKPEEVLHLRYFNPNFNYIGAELIGLSPLTAGNKVLTMQQAETDYSVNSFQNCGISGIVSNESVTEDVSTEVLGKLKIDFYGDATGVQNARKLLFQAGKINYTAVGLSPVDMDMINREIRTFKKLCNLYSVSDLLFNNDDAGTFNNMAAVIRQLYTNAALPEVYAFRDILNNQLVPKFNTGKVKYYIDCDTSGIIELQDDLLNMMQAFAAAPVMIPNVVLEAQGLGKSADDGMDDVYIKAGYEKVKDFNDIPDIPIVTNNGR